ncbi:hypothetical protein SAMN05216262_11283 [Colwellia chukchiensis]|uniref:PhoD-like phosphatase n=1 Tax=Colwellia chukchiensis TaxID=641665 RepID=A0A1H7QS82_9GAMM|nr:alkaline phosphatase family protein [Colwellia chukchiensis]SEL50739.1 hypothetical protein SAMN05216262_11283 [Colwellia chukchiensis]
MSQQQLTFWLVTSQSYRITLQLFVADQPYKEIELTPAQHQQVPVAKHAIVNLLSISFSQALPTDTLLAYNFIFSTGEQQLSLSALLPELLYPQQKYPNFVIRKTLKQVLHGSCRKPHFDSGDGLLQVDQVIEHSINQNQERPALLMMSGDQIYADDVAGPMLVAIHQVIDLLGLHDEQWQGSVVSTSEALYKSRYCYYQRDQLLPDTRANQAVYDKLFAASKKPIFTSVNAKNHLVTLAEVMAMYFLTWSPTLWRLVDLNRHHVPAVHAATYQREAKVIAEFADGLSAVSRALAHIPSYMIFDDHDISDDWNLNRAWEEAAYHHPFSRRIIGNALIGYWLCQGWGNAPDKFLAINNKVPRYFTEQGYCQQEQLIEQLLAWQDWHYSLATEPKVIVLDTRTQRWRSERNANKPSGLMDWQSLSELQQELLNQPNVILVSPAPIYGVKMIETIQRIFTFFGFPLMVDAENWMAHSGTANVMLNIFRHPKTPPNFIILSGDVHYSFFYEVTHRFRRNDARIFQITSSGIKNQFPRRLLQILDWLNRVLYASYSPLNWFTKRRRMKVQVRKPLTKTANTLVNHSGIGLITLTSDHNVVQAQQLTTMNKRVRFADKDSSEH